jgi:phosphoadenosine phosphosulfate reductase
MNSLNDKVQKAHETLKKADKKFDTLCVGWTGGKDSTLTLHLFREALGKNPDKVMFVDTGRHFEEVYNFVEKWRDNWNLDLVIARNDKVIKNQEKFKEELNNAETKNQLLKTLPMHQEIERHNIDAMINGIRWDETEARADENFFSERKYEENPAYNHTRIHPILPFTEQDVWDYTHKHDLPVNPKYEEGFRSLGSKDDTEKSEDGVPAWKQNFEESPERVGREQDKENVMRKLRDWN